MNENFAVFILSYNRPDNVKTLETLKKCKYTGKYYIVIGKDEPKKDLYIEYYGKKVIQFDKEKIMQKFDTGDNFGVQKAVIYARNVCFDIAEKLGIDYFLELDDDYDSFAYRYVKKEILYSCNCKSLDKVFSLMVNFLEVSGANTVAFSQRGETIGGYGAGIITSHVKRKAMNSFFCKTSRRFNFIGTINEDVNSYAYYGQIGKLFFTIMDFSLNQGGTQKVDGGMTSTYLDMGTYFKSFYSVMFAPSCVKIATLGPAHKRIHHKVLWNNCTPKIISDKYKKDR